jgi:hypothetical protein
VQQQGIREALEALGLCHGRERREIPVGISGIYSDRLGSDQIFPLTTEKQIQGFNTITSALHVFQIKPRLFVVLLVRSFSAKFAIAASHTRLIG